MAIVDQNVLTLGLRGRVGNLIFRRWGNRSVVSAAPIFGKRRWSRLQRENRDRFREAMAWARLQMKDPVQRERFRKRTHAMQTVWNIAVSEYLLRPVIKEVDTAGYTGAPGDAVRVKMLRTRYLRALFITILTAQGAVVESGEAVRIENTNEWHYTCRRKNPSVRGCSIRVQATGLRRITASAQVAVRRE